MNELTAALKEELNVDTAFTLPIFGGIDIPESIAVSWGIMAFLVIVSILLTRNLKVNHISKRQAILETAVVTMDNFFKDLLGEAGKQYVPYLITVALYIACSNLIGIIGLKPPTKDLNVTAALAIRSMICPNGRSSTWARWTMLARRLPKRAVWPDGKVRSEHHGQQRRVFPGRVRKPDPAHR